MRISLKIAGIIMLLWSGAFFGRFIESRAMAHVVRDRNEWEDRARVLTKQLDETTGESIDNAQIADKWKREATADQACLRAIFAKQPYAGECKP